MTRVSREKAELRARVNEWKRAGEVVGVVPTMGALHAGHLSLVKRACAECDRVIVTIFVNPRQFNNASDLDKYPRTEESDLAALAPFPVDAVYIPGPGQIYPEGFATTVLVAGLTEGLCGAFRPGHFDGVTTVVPKLFLQTGADRAYFGEKDYQQLQVVTRMARDLDIPVEVVPCETVREEDGLALSSRNALLPSDTRTAAAVLYSVLRETADALGGGTALADLRDGAEARLLEAGFDKIEYLELRAVGTLEPMERVTGPARLLVAAWLGGVRLIDNLAVEG